MTKTFEASSSSQLAVNASPPSPPSSSSSSGNNNEGGSGSGSTNTSGNTSNCIAMPKAPDKIRSKPFMYHPGPIGIDGSGTAGYGPGIGTGSGSGSGGHTIISLCDQLQIAKTTSLAEEKSVTNLDDEGLRALLDEAITYKTPKDREGKSKLFNSLLSDAEDEIRKKHAYNASGPARHYSTTAKKRHRHRRQPSSISENLTHGGSLNDLAKQELYESTKMQRPKTVSTRQREGGSLPCNVNAGASIVDKQYFMEARAKQQEQRNKSKEYMGIDSESQSLIEDDSLSQEHCSDLDEMKTCHPLIPRVSNLYTSKATLQVAKVDDALSFPQMTQCGEIGLSGNARDSVLRHASPIAHHGLVNRDVPMYPRQVDCKKQSIDENGNALAAMASSSVSGFGQGLPTTSTSASAIDAKKRKKEKKKSSENVKTADQIVGHRADIIDDIDKLYQFIVGEDETKNKKLHKQHTHSLNNEDKNKNSKRTRKKSNSMVQKSNSMEEISITKLEDFSCRFDAIDVKEKAPLRPTKSNAERPSRHGKSWVLSSEQLPIIYPNSTSAENLEIADFIYVTKKKKSKKRRNSLGSRGHKQANCDTRPAEFHSLRVSSPRRKSASSAPHSNKSNESSDNESVHSLPLDVDADDNKNQQISYADIAKSSERPKWNRPPSERRKSEKSLTLPTNNNKSEEKTSQPTPLATTATGGSVSVVVTTNVINQNANNVVTVATQQVEPKEVKPTDTDLSSLQNWPEIRNNKVNSAKTNSLVDNVQHVNVVQQVQDWPSIISNGSRPQPQPTPIQTHPNHLSQPVTVTQQILQTKQQQNPLPNQPQSQLQLQPQIQVPLQQQIINPNQSQSNMMVTKHVVAAPVQGNKIADDNKNQVKCGAKPNNTIVNANKSISTANTSNVANINNYNVKSANKEQGHGSMQQGQAQGATTFVNHQLQQGYHIKSGSQSQQQDVQPKVNNQLEQIPPQLQQMPLQPEPISAGIFNQEDDVVLNNTQQVLQQVSEQQQPQFLYQYKMPPNIRDVQSIEKMQMRSLQAAQMSPHNNGGSGELENDTNSSGIIQHSHTHSHTTSTTTSRHNSHTHSDKHRPAVVILSSGADRHVPDLTFGFGINEQLLSGDVCADFVNRFYMPDVPPHSPMHIDKLVNYIGSEWQDVLVQTHTGKVKYYTDDLS